MKQHPKIGLDILCKVETLNPVADIVRHHHERWDGTGYPDGFSGNAIPLGVRIIAVADAYDAMTSFRCYRSQYSHKYTIQEIERCQGSQFDPAVAKAFLQMDYSIDDVKGKCGNRIFA